MKTARNDACPCGSGKKYKKCCLNREDGGARARSRLGVWLCLAVILVAGVLYFVAGPQLGSLVGVAGLVAVVAYLVFSDPPSSSGPGNPGSINFGR